MQTIGRYTLQRELGKGSRGQVYLAKDPVIDREVVLKTLRTELAGNPEEARELLERFRMEARALGQLKHPAIVTIYDVGQDEATGVPYLAMEYVPGADLQTVTRSGMTLPILQVADIGAQVASTLEFTHRNGLIHRDIKPSNLLLGVDGRVRIADFGIVKFQGADITHVGLTLGTPSYMSPEQVRGDVVDGRSDIFSLGVVLYELLTGEKPFAGGSAGEVARRVLRDHPLAPTSRRARVPKDLSSFVMRCLEKEPPARWQRAGELAEALEAVVRREREASDQETRVQGVVVDVPSVAPPSSGALGTSEGDEHEPAGAAGTGTPLPSAEATTLVAERDLIPLDPLDGPEHPAAAGRWVAGAVGAALLGIAALVWVFGDELRATRLFGGERPWVFSVGPEELPPRTPDAPRRTPIAIPGSERSPEVKKRLDVARRDLDAGRFDEAASKLRAIVAMAPDDAEAKELLGRAERRVGRPR